MRRVERTRSISLALVAVFAIIVSSRSFSVSASAGTAPPSPFTPPAADCVAEPRTVEGLIALFSDATPVTDPPDWTSAVVPLGPAAPDEVSIAVKTVVTQAFACLNAGEMTRFLGLMTDQVILVNFYWLAETLASGDMPDEFTNPQPVEADFQQTILAIGDVSLFSDGRAGTAVSFVDPGAEDSEVEVLYLIFTYQDEQWLIDEAIEL